MARVDPYLSKLNCTKRLVSEWQEHRSLVIAYEFDNTVFDPKKGDTVFPAIVEALRRAESAGLHLVMFTGRENEELAEAVSYLNSHRIPFHYVNKSPEYIPYESQKPFYNLLLDSRAGLSEALEHLNEVLAHIRSVSVMDNLHMTSP